MKYAKELTRKQIQQMVMHVYPNATNFSNNVNFYYFEVDGEKYSYCFIDDERCLDQFVKIYKHTGTIRSKSGEEYICTITFEEAYYYL